MSQALCDVLQDAITDTAKRLGVDVTQVFLRAAESAGFTNPELIAAHRRMQWVRSGFHVLPLYIKEFCLRTCNGEIEKGV